MGTLYFAPRTRATRPLWTLEELGVPFELEQLDMAAGAHKKPGYLAIHPLGKVPAWRDENGVLIESVGISMYLADRYPEAGLAPAPDSPDRGRYCQWCAFVAGSVEPAVVEMLMARRDHGADSEQAVAALETLHRVVGLMDAQLAQAPYLAGASFSVADVLNAGVLMWASAVADLTRWTHVADWLGRVRERPAYTRAMSR